MMSFLRRIVPLGSVLVLAVVVWIIFGEHPPEQRFGTTTGTIIVSSPEVYSRERLVNDRFQEATWLESELRDINNLHWGSEASMSSSRSDRIKLEAQGGGDQSTNNAKSPESAQAADSTNPTQRPNVPPSQQGSTDGTAQSSPIDRFRDRVAYREEVRAASLETQLDDRHDIAGNTLYRVKFSVTIVPEHDTSAWALVYVELKGADDSRGGKEASSQAYRQWLEYYEEQLNSELDRLSERSTRQWQPDEFRRFSGYVARALQQNWKLASATSSFASNPAIRRGAIVRNNKSDAIRRSCHSVAAPGTQATMERWKRSCRTIVRRATRTLPNRAGRDRGNSFGK